MVAQAVLIKILFKFKVLGFFYHFMLQTNRNASALMDLHTHLGGNLLHLFFLQCLDFLGSNNLGLKSSPPHMHRERAWSQPASHSSGLIPLWRVQEDILFQLHGSFLPENASS